MISKSYIILGKKELDKEKFTPIKNRMGSIKPEGGLWASPYYPNREYISGWHEWCFQEMNDWLSNDAVILELEDNSRIFTIDSQEDLIEFVNKAGEPQNEFSELGFKFQAISDFEKASQLFDAILLTEKGQWDTRFPSNKHEYNLYGWDCESILILNFDCIKKWEYKKLDIVKEDNNK